MALALACERDPHRGVARLHRARRQAADADVGRHDPRRLREHPRQLHGWRIVPGVAILIVVFALNLLGDGLRDAIDPKLRGET